MSIDRRRSLIGVSKKIKKLYWYGDECVENSGGWVHAGYLDKEYTDSGFTLTKYQDYMNIRIAGNASGNKSNCVCSRKGIDGEGFTKAYVLARENVNPDATSCIRMRNTYDEDKNALNGNFYYPHWVDGGAGIAKRDDYKVYEFRLKDGKSVEIYGYWYVSPYHNIDIKAIWLE